MYLAPLNYDKFFIKVFSDIEITKQFLSDILMHEVQELEFLKRKQRVTDDAAFVEFDFRCKIEDSYVILDMQQWYKMDIIHRFYIYHTLNSSLQLEDLPMKNMFFIPQLNKFKKEKDYRKIEPVYTLIWLVHDTLGTDRDYISYSMNQDVILDFVRNEKIWYKPEIVELVKAREKVLNQIGNDSKGLDFIPKNKLIFLLQQNIVKNKTLEKYDRWFEFAEKTWDDKNTKEDFEEFAKDRIFAKMMNRLVRSDLPEEDIKYIEDEKKALENFYSWKESIKEEGRKEGEEKGMAKLINNMLQSGMSPDQISGCTGASVQKINELREPGHIGHSPISSGQ